MDLTTSIGQSTLEDAYEAGRQAAEQAREGLGDRRAGFVFVLGTIGYEQEDLVDAVRETFPDAPMAGATFEGVIGREFCEEGMYAVQVVAMAAKTVRFHGVLAENVTDDGDAAGRALGEAVAAVPVAEGEQKVLILLADFRANIDALFDGIRRHGDVPILGGTAGDNMRFLQCYQYYDGRVLSNAACGAVLAGGFRYETALAHGSEPMGAVSVVTRSEGNRVLEVDGRPALDVASERFGEPITADNQGKATLLMGVGFEMADPGGYPSPYIARAAVAYDFEARAFALPVAAPEGTRIQFMHRDAEQVVRSGQLGANSVQETLAAIPAEPQLAVQFDCAGRGRSMLGDRVASGIKSIQERFPADMPWMGCFSFGQISPVNGDNCFHNYTATMALFY